MTKSIRSPKDSNVPAFSIVEPTTVRSDAKPSDVSAALDNVELRRQLMREMGRRGGKKGGKSRAKNLTAKERTEIAKLAAKARWGRNSK